MDNLFWLILTPDVEVPFGEVRNLGAANGAKVRLGLGGLGLETELQEVRDGDGRQDADDGNDDHQLDEGEAFPVPDHL